MSFLSFLHLTTLMGRLGTKKNSQPPPTPKLPPQMYIHLTLSEKNSEMPFIFFSMVQIVWGWGPFSWGEFFTSLSRWQSCWHQVIMQAFCGQTELQDENQWVIRMHLERKMEENFSWSNLTHSGVKPIWVRWKQELLINNRISTKSIIELMKISKESPFVLEYTVS